MLHAATLRPKALSMEWPDARDVKVAPVKSKSLARRAGESRAGRPASFITGPAERVGMVECKEGAPRATPRVEGSYVVRRQAEVATCQEDERAAQGAHSTAAKLRSRTSSRLLLIIGILCCGRQNLCVRTPKL